MDAVLAGSDSIFPTIGYKSLQSFIFFYCSYLLFHTLIKTYSAKYSSTSATMKHVFYLTADQKKLYAEDL